MHRILLAFFLVAASAAGASVDLSQAVVVVRPGTVPALEKTAGIVLVEELERRSGIRLRISSEWPAQGTAIALTSAATVPGWTRPVPSTTNRAEGFRLKAESNVVWIHGADPRGVFYGVGHLLRQLQWSRGALAFPAGFDITTSPELPIRGHQLGYRNTANSWDAWTVDEYERYIRELALFGANAVEGIPFGEGRSNPLQKVPKRAMNRAITEICARYGLDYWIWAPVSFDPSSATKAGAYLNELTTISQDSTTLTGVFVPGGDPGDNPPEILIPFLAQMAARVRAVHPKAQIWLSLQGFDEAKAATVYRWLARETPPWFGGIVAGPSSPPVADTRRRIPENVKLRLYPDVSHNVRSQFKVPDLDMAYALTLGREAVNPRPFEYAARHRKIAPLSDGSITYSDGVHDDVNKVLWTALDWNPLLDPREIVTEYARFHFSSQDAVEIADAILALERNWQGALVANGGVEGTLRWWQALEAKHPELASNWRWQMHALRAVYDAYVRRRLLEDSQAEAEANAALVRAGSTGVDAAITAAKQALARGTRENELRGRIIELCGRLWESIHLQTSVGKYQASNPERGAVLDFIDLPLNNRWWLEDEMAKARALPTEAARVSRLMELGNWEATGDGRYYDDLGNIAKMPHVERVATEEYAPLFWWRELGLSRERRSWLVTMWPKQMVYEGLDPRKKYVVRTTGYGQALLQIDGMRVRPTRDGREIGEFKEFSVPAAALTDGRLVLTWDRAGDEEHLNWRQKSRLSEVWVLALE